MTEQDSLFLAASLAEDGMPISAGEPTFFPRRLVVRLYDREKTDPSALLTAIQNALSSHGVSLEWEFVSGDSNGVRQ